MMGSPLTTRSTEPLPVSLISFSAVLVYKHQYGPVSSTVRLLIVMSMLGKLRLLSIFSLLMNSPEMMGFLSLADEKTSSLWRRPFLIFRKSCSGTMDLHLMVKNPPRSLHATPPLSVQKKNSSINLTSHLLLDSLIEIRLTQAAERNAGQTKDG